MGGPGSGTWYRWTKKTYADELKNIDVRYLKKQGLLKPGYTGSLSWSRNGESTGSIGYTMHTDRMILNYRHRQYDEDWQDVKDTIRLVQTACHFGGYRKWFICPSCSKRVGILYGPSKFFRCRTCYGLAYASQSEGQLDRMCRKARKIRRKLDFGIECWEPDCLSDPIFMKPKGMEAAYI